MPPSVKPIETEKLLIAIEKFLQVYRLTLEAGAVEGYMRTLAGLSEEELAISLERANRENKTDFAPGPGVIYAIAMEIRDGSAAGYVLREMQSWPDSGPHTEWVEDEEWKALKARIGVRKLRPMVAERVAHAVRDLQDPAYLQELANLSRQLNAHYANQSTDPSLPRSQAEIEAVEQATGRRIAKPRRRQ